MSEITLYHNPRCSKSRQALQLLNERGITPTILLYLENPPDVPTLRRLLQQLNLPARALLRSGEAEYRALGLDDPACDEETIIAAMAASGMRPSPSASGARRASSGKMGPMSATSLRPAAQQRSR